jgi:nucleoside-diphosphate-sugar epimerase
MSVLVAGSGGFIGSSLAEYFESIGVSVMKTNRDTELETHHNTAGCIIFCLGIADHSFCNDNPLDACSSHITSLVRYLDFSSKNSIKKFIFLSTSQVYGSGEGITEDGIINTENVYSALKYSGEVICQTYGKMYNINMIILRLDNVFGKNMKTFPTIIVSKLKSDDQISLFCKDGDPSKTYIKKWVYIEELSSFIYFLINTINYTLTINVTGNTQINNADFVNEIAKKINIIPKIKFIEDKVKRPLTLDMSNKLMNNLGWKWRSTLDEQISLFLS